MLACSFRQRCEKNSVQIYPFSILFNEIFSEDRLKILIENAFKDVIEKKAKEILIETFRRKKAQSE